VVASAPEGIPPPSLPLPPSTLGQTGVAGEAAPDARARVGFREGATEAGAMTEGGVADETTEEGEGCGAPGRAGGVVEPDRALAGGGIEAAACVGNGANHHGINNG